MLTESDKIALTNYAWSELIAIAAYMEANTDKFTLEQFNFLYQEMKKRAN